MKEEQVKSVENNLILSKTESAYAVEPGTIVILRASFRIEAL